MRPYAPMLTAGVRFQRASDPRPLVHSIGDDALTRCGEPYQEPCDVVQGASLQDVCLSCRAAEMRADPRVILDLDATGWLEVAPAAGGYTVEHHVPVRGASVGYIDRPTVATGPLPAVLRAVLDGSPHDPLRILSTLETLLAAKGGGEPEL